MLRFDLLKFSSSNTFLHTAQIQHFASARDFTIGGVYFAADTLEDNEFSGASSRFANQFVSMHPSAAIFILDNMKLRRGDEIAITPMILRAGKLHRTSAQLFLEDGHALDLQKKMIAQNSQFSIVDMEQHLDRPQLDWTNAAVEVALSRKEN